MNQELPAMSSTAYMSTAYNGIGEAVGSSQMNLGSAVPANLAGTDPWHAQQALGLIFQGQQQASPRKPPTQEKEPSMTRRIVQIFIVDPHESIPLSDSLVYRSSEPFLTDLTDQELFYDLDIKQLLAGHNAKRTTVVNKAIKDRTEHLEPARVRDLKMNITVVAQF